MATTAGLIEPFKTQCDRLIAASAGKVWCASGFRTREQQIELRRINGCPDVMNSPPDACRVPTARPGQSMHERGQAIDFGGDLGVAAQLAPTYGLHRTVPGEAWHYELIPGFKPAPAPVPPPIEGATVVIFYLHTAAGGLEAVALPNGKLIHLNVAPGQYTQGATIIDLLNDPVASQHVIDACGGVIG